MAKGAYIDPYLCYTSPPAPTGIDDFGLYNYTSAPLRGKILLY
ncbi:thermopsin [Acidilobus sp. 7A]|nr:thermopsin [Acidilobus sp. 7A]